MFGLGPRELRFAVMISSAHMAQHFLMRLIPPLIPILAIALAYPLWQLGLLVSLYSFGSGLMQAPLGVLSDRYDRVYLLPTGIAVGGASYLAFGAAEPLGRFVPTLIVAGYPVEGGFVIMGLAMLGVGIGTAVVHPTGYPLISANVSDDNKGKVLGAFGSFAKFGDAMAPSVIGVLILVMVWESIVMILGVAGVAYAAVLYLVLRRDEFETVPAGPAGDGTDGAADATGEPTAATADNRTYLYPLVVIYVFFITKMFASNGLNAFVPAFIVGVYAYSFEVLDVALAPESVANFYFAFLLLAAATCQIGIGALTDRHDPRTIILACLAVATVALLALAILELTPLSLLLVVVILGGSLWGTNPARDGLISEISPPEREGRTFGYLWTAVHLTGAAIPAVIGFIIDAVGFREGFVLLAAGTVLAAGSIGLLYLDRVYAPAPDPDPDPTTVDDPDPSD